MRNRILLSMLGFGLSAFLMGSATMAWFTSSTQVAGNTITAGTIEIGAERSAWTASYNNMAPGEKVETTLTVRNSGTLTMKYRMYGKVVTEQSDATLAHTLKVSIVDPVTNNTVRNEIFLDEFTVANAVVRDGTLVVPAGGSQELKVIVHLPNSAGNNVAGKKVTVQFLFDATQPENEGWGQ
jgi:predicted ribosomally synthesized peptide with SipW-like signal peptide